MDSILVLIVIAGCTAFQYFKGSIVRGIVTIMVALTASFFSFGYFETLGRLLGKQSEGLVSISQCLSFTFLFILAFALLQSLAVFLMKENIHFGTLPERIGRGICGIFLGWILAGVLLTAMALLPISGTWPYARFEEGNPRVDSPNKALLNADGLVTSLFSLTSKGSFRALLSPQSFAALHPNFLDQLFLNRHRSSEKDLLATPHPAIDLPRKAAAWPVPESIVDEQGNPLQGKSGCRAMIIRVGFTFKGNGSPFTLCQLRAICVKKDNASKPLAGKGRNVYPSGYMISVNQVAIKRLGAQVTLSRQNYVDAKKFVDFLFYVPTDSIPVFMAFKQNNIVTIPKPVSTDQAPQIVPFPG